MKFTLPELPYAKDALAPYISAEGFDYHHGKHHAAYVNKLNELVAGTDLENKMFGKTETKTFKVTIKGGDLFVKRQSMSFERYVNPNCLTK